MMSNTASIESRIYEHVLGGGQSHMSLLSTGVLSDEWTNAYLELLEEAVKKCEGQPSLPRDIVAAVHFASWYLNIRYDAWRSLKDGRRNEQTERNLARLRTPSEFLLLSSHVDRAKAQHAKRGECS
jgi:hypothetical protein